MLFTFTRVLIIDDVITAGTAIREAFGILEKTNAQVAGVCISLDRQEKVSIEDTRSAIDQVRETFGIPVVSIATLDNLVGYLATVDAASDANASFLPVIRTYRADYGVSKQ
ncbi:unnamed protein product [Phytophthora fragariaefolia]|uniref:Unnamed protein product n=1 Tax=Phytophthora fragariaefolia TaxID=1490495 RepID=A0A9W6WSJ3_9STRA|nr:unnamed protein product [Phytophthora fragariaefolia]